MKYTSKKNSSMKDYYLKKNEENLSFINEKVRETVDLKWDTKSGIARKMGWSPQQLTNKLRGFPAGEFKYSEVQKIAECCNYDVVWIPKKLEPSKLWTKAHPFTNDIRMTEKEDAYEVKVPTSPGFDLEVAALGGTWNSMNCTWTFPKEKLAQVRKLMRKNYGYDDASNEWAPEWVDVRKAIDICAEENDEEKGSNT